MTAKEEASALVKKFYQLRAYEVMNDTGKKISHGIAKESAIICVDEMIERLNAMCFNNGLNEHNQLEDEFIWLRKIKQEIEAL